MIKKQYDFELLFRALADHTRLRLINLVANGEVCVCSLVEVLNTSQPKVSRHLAYLRRAGLVSPRRQGKWMYYSLCEPADAFSAKIFRDVLVWLASNTEMHIDRNRLEKIHVGPQVPQKLHKAYGSFG